MKKLGYDGEAPEFIIYFILMIVVPCALVMIGLLWWKDNLGSLIGLGVAFFIFWFCLFMDRITRYSNRASKNRLIKRNGQLVDGEIIGYGVRSESNNVPLYNGKDKNIFEYFLYVTFVNPLDGKSKVVTTPDLNFIPDSVLGSKKCRVYVNDNDFYVTGFVKCQSGHPIKLDRIDNNNEAA